MLNLDWHKVPVLSHRQTAHGSMECQLLLQICHCGSALCLSVRAVSGNCVRSEVYEGHWMMNQSLHLYTPSSPIELTIVAAYWLDHPKLLLTGFNGFLARDSTYAIARYMLSPVRPSVRLSVRLIHGWISQRRLTLGSRNLHRRVAPWL